MYVSYRALLICCCIFVVATLFGCAVPQSGVQTETYQPVVQPGMTWADAVNVLLNTLHDRHPVGKQVLANYLTVHGNYANAFVQCNIDNNRITIVASNGGHKLAEFGLYVLLGHTVVVDVGTGNRPSSVALPGGVKLVFDDRSSAAKVADALYFMQQHLKNYRDSLEKRLAEFEPVAAQYRAMETKPQMSEEQRKLVVQANALTEKKQYADAREKYRAAIALDPTSYPGAYFNLALLDAQMNLPFSAISYMKHYLLLVPDAPDARSAQDKIYEWELLMPASFAREATTNISTDPPDALLELNVSESGKEWVYLGRAPGPARFWRSDPKCKLCLIRASKPGYVTEERTFPFESLPADVHIPLRESGSGQDTHGYLGISFVEMTEELAKSSELQPGRGVAVKELTQGGPGDRAGLQPSDIILAIAGEDIDEAIDLPRTAASTPVGETVELKILRKGQTQAVTIKIGKLPK